MTGSEWRFELRPDDHAPRERISLDEARQVMALLISVQQTDSIREGDLDEIDQIFARWIEAGHSADEIAVAVHLPLEVARKAIAAGSISSTSPGRRK